MAEATGITPQAPGLRILKKEAIAPLPLEIRPTTSNKRRLGALRQAFPDVEIAPVEGGDEQQISNVVEIAKDKILFGKGRIEKKLHEVSAHNPAAPKKRTVYIAGDTRLSALSKNEHGIAALESRSHEVINSQQDIQHVFQEMLEGYEASVKNPPPTLPYYQIQSGSGVLLEAPKTDPMLHATYHTSTIQLDLDMVKRFATPEGIQEYLEACDKFHASSVYKEVETSSDKEHERQIFKIASGLELATLIRIGAVTEIDSIHRSSPEFRDEAYDALYNALVGISPQLLNQIDPQAEARLQEWGWLNRVTDYALEDIEKPQLEQAA